MVIGTGQKVFLFWPIWPTVYTHNQKKQIFARESSFKFLINSITLILTFIFRKIYLFVTFKNIYLLSPCHRNINKYFSIIFYNIYNLIKSEFIFNVRSDNFSVGFGKFYPIETNFIKIDLSFLLKFNFLTFNPVQ